MSNQSYTPRYTQPTMIRAQKVLNSVLDGHSVLYSSGLAVSNLFSRFNFDWTQMANIQAAFAALIHVVPQVIAIRDGYHGCHEGIKVYQRLRPETVCLQTTQPWQRLIRNAQKVIDIDDDFGEGTLCWLGPYHLMFLISVIINKKSKQKLLWILPESVEI